ncbi:MAG: hypothetical protein ACKO24_17195 [Leptolyngbyaceae cyanobacterium]
MLRQNSSSASPDPGFKANPGSTNGAVSLGGAHTSDFDIQRELNRLEELILDSPRIPLSRRTLIDEEHLLEQLDVIRLSLPDAFQQADDLLRHKDELLMQAEQCAQQIIEQAERRAAQLMNEMGILRQAELEVQALKQQALEDCEVIREQAIAEIEQLQRQAQRDLEEMKRHTLAECEEIQAGADEYADRVLREMELQLSEMMRVVRNGRQQLQPETAPRPREGGKGASIRPSPAPRADRSNRS